MAFVLPAIKAKLGTTAYYILSMKAQELVKNAVIPREVEGWADLTIDERYQRDINEHRVKVQIAPYLANNDDRFFGSIILAVQNFDGDNAFEPLSKFTAKSLPRLYAGSSEQMGFLTFGGGETFIPLDGQHRLEAIKYAISGKDSKGKDVPNVDKPCPDLANEDVTVILVDFQKDKARKIFTKVNRYARSTSTGENIITDDDDFVAVLAREIAGEEGIIPGQLVKYKNNILSATDKEFTTLSTIYNCNHEIIKASFPAAGKISNTELPSKNEQTLYRDEVFGVWRQMVDSIEFFRDGLSDPNNDDGNKKRREIRKLNLLGKPVVQECLVRAYMRLTNSPTNMPDNKACEKLNALPWALTNENISKVWDRLLWTGDSDKGKIITKNRDIAARIIAYMAGENLSEESKKVLLQDYLNLFPEAEKRDKTLPARLAD